MKTLAVLLVSVLSLAACNAERRPDIPVQENFPPVGLASTAIWLENRQVPVARRVRAADIPTEDLCDIVDDCVPVTRFAAQ